MTTEAMALPIQVGDKGEDGNGFPFTVTEVEPSDVGLAVMYRFVGGLLGHCVVIEAPVPEFREPDWKGSRLSYSWIVLNGMRRAAVSTKSADVPRDAPLADDIAFVRAELDGIRRRQAEEIAE